MARKQSRTKLNALTVGARTLDDDMLVAVSGGMRFGGFAGGLGVVNSTDTWTWTDPVEVGDIKRKDDE